jgi:hypothetical protein
MTDREYMRARLKLLSEAGVLVGTPEQYIARHEAANAARRDQIHRDIADQTGWTGDNMDLIS